MTVHVLTGPEPYRRYPVVALLASAGVPVVHADADEDLPRARQLLAAGEGLFGPTALRLVNADKVPAAELAAAAADYPALLVIEADTLPVKTIRALGTGAVVQSFTATGKGAQAGLSAAAASLGVEIPPAASALLLERTTGDPGHAVSVLAACASAGISPVTVGHVKALAVASEESGAPWLLLDQLLSGRRAGLVAMLEGSDPIPTVAFLAKRWLVTALVAEGSADRLDELVGNVTDAAVRDASRLAGRLPSQAAAAILSALADADLRAKSGQGAEAVSLAATSIITHAARDPR